MAHDVFIGHPSADEPASDAVCVKRDQRDVLSAGSREYYLGAPCPEKAPQAPPGVGTGRIGRALGTVCFFCAVATGIGGGR